MTRLRALNDSLSEDSEEEVEEKETLEAQEERAFSEYKRALELRQQAKYADAEKLFISLLNDDFLASVESCEKRDNADGLARPAVALKYACLKNLAGVLILQSRANDGLSCLIQAAELDDTDVTLWQQMGNAALQVDDFHLASHAFQEGLRCNPRHWPCLDSLLPVLYAIDDYLGCLLLIARTLQLDAEYPQALALRNQIAKEQPSLIENFKCFFPYEEDINLTLFEVEEEVASTVSHAQSLRERWKKILKESEAGKETSLEGIMCVELLTKSWLELGKHLLQLYRSIDSNKEASLLKMVRIQLPESKINSNDVSNGEKMEVEGSHVPVVDIESEEIELDSEQEAEAEYQEEDGTEASGHGQDKDNGTQNTLVSKLKPSTSKRKRGSTSVSFMDQYSKRRSGRRSTRKVEEINLASKFCSFLPESLLPDNFEDEVSRINKKRFTSDPLELLSLGEDSVDSVKLHHSLQECGIIEKRQKSQGSVLVNEDITRCVSKEKYFGTVKEESDVLTFLKQHGDGCENVIELLSEYVRQLVSKESLTWPPELVPVYMGAYECMQKHFSYLPPGCSLEPTAKQNLELKALLLFCEFCIDTWKQKDSKPCEDNLEEDSQELLNAIGHLMLHSSQAQLFSSGVEQCKVLLRIHWLKAHFFLLQDNASAAIHSFQDVLDGLKIAEGCVNACLNTAPAADDANDNSIDNNQGKRQTFSVGLPHSYKNHEAGAKKDECTKNEGCKDISLVQSGQQNLASCKDVKKGVEFLAAEHPVVSNDNGMFSLVLTNSRIHSNISKVSVEQLLTSLTRQHQLSAVDEMYESQQYEALVGTLTECFTFCAQQADTNFVSSNDGLLPDRPTQFAMLLDSLWQLQKYGECYYWAESCLHEAFSRYMKCTEAEKENQQLWCTVIEKLLAGMESCHEVAGQSSLDRLPSTHLIRLVKTLTSMLCLQLDQSDTSLVMAVECTTLWVILYRVVLFEEQRQPKKTDVIPSSMSVLFTAHDYMARHGRCCMNEGALLNLILEEVVPQLRSSELVEIQDELYHQIEQAIFCMFNHPKKGRESCRKRLQDHKVEHQLNMTWKQAVLLLSFYDPEELPTYDSTYKISADEEQLFLFISKLIPEECNPSHFKSNMKAYIRGKSNTRPEVSTTLPNSAHNLYYLLGDFYMKTYKWDPAVKFYMLDICVNPSRFDSWAGMALARSAIVTTLINSCGVLKNEILLLQATEAQVCFQSAMDLDPGSATLWIEYGNFAYVVHSFWSRLLKTETDSLSIEMFNKLEEEKDKLLALTEKCFREADKLNQDEGWLHQYMLGKVAEKRGENANVFLKHYREAAFLLSESNAEYPLTLNYDPPQTYAFEAHEVHYRIHASILKYLESMEGKVLDADMKLLLETTIVEASQSPFMMAALNLGQPATQGAEFQRNTKRKSVDSYSMAVEKRPKIAEIYVAGLAMDDAQRTGDIYVLSEDGKDSKDSKNVLVENCTQNQAHELGHSKSVTDNGMTENNSSSATQDFPVPSVVQSAEPYSATQAPTPNLTVTNANLINVESMTTDKRPCPTLEAVRENLKLPVSGGTLDHAELVNPCLAAMEECLARYPHHYKSQYRLCHYYFRSKKNRNLKKCRQLFLGDYRVGRVHKNINGLFKSSSINSMFNDVWRIPVEEVDRAGSFASHMNRCVVLLMEFLRDEQDYSMLLKLGVFLKKEPEKKDKKYLRDNERTDLSNQALAMCIATLRSCAKQTRSINNILEIFPTVKDGIKDLPQKEATFKAILVDAFRKLKDIKSDTIVYENAVEFCQSEINRRKAQTPAHILASVPVAQTQMASANLQTSFLEAGMSAYGVQPMFPLLAPASAAVSSVHSQYLPRTAAPAPALRGRGRSKSHQPFNPHILPVMGVGGLNTYQPSVEMMMQTSKPDQQQKRQLHPEPRYVSCAPAPKGVDSSIALQAGLPVKKKPRAGFPISDKSKESSAVLKQNKALLLKEKEAAIAQRQMAQLQAAQNQLSQLQQKSSTSVSKVHIPPWTPRPGSPIPDKSKTFSALLRQSKAQAIRGRETTNGRGQLQQLEAAQSGLSELNQLQVAGAPQAGAANVASSSGSGQSKKPNDQEVDVIVLD